MTQPAVRRSRTFVQRTTAWIPALVLVLLFAPMAVTNRSFGIDWTLHLWLVRQQELNIQTMWHPGLFVSAEPLGVFYPVFSFVGSGVYTVGGLLAIALGDRPLLAYKLLYLAGLGLAYGGMTWLSVQIGLRGWRSQISGLVLVTGAYFVTDMVGRGDLGEFIALASIPFLIAAICAALTTSTLRSRNLVALVLGTFVLTGSHNITLLWGSVFVTLLGVVATLAFVRSWRPSIPWRRFRMLVLGAAIGAGLNAWYLFPDLAYGLDTRGAQTSQSGLPAIRLTQLGLLFNPLRTALRPSLSRDLRVTFPWMFALWALAFGIAFWRGKDRPSKTLFVGLFGVAVVYLVLLFDQSAWRLLPSVLYNLQFTWRLHAYLLLVTAWLVMIVLLWHTSARPSVQRAATLVLVAFVLFNVGAATWQVWRVRPTAMQDGHLRTTNDAYVNTVVAARTTAPSSWYAPAQFRDGSPPVVTTDPARTVDIPAAAVVGDRFEGVLRLPDGPAPFGTNITAARSFLRFTGIAAVGRDARGFLVAVRAPDAPVNGPVKVTIRQANTVVLTAGAAMSLLSLVVLVGLLGWPYIARLRTRERALSTDAGHSSQP